MVSGLSGGLHRLRQALGNMKWPLTRSTSPRDGKGTVIFSSTDEVLPLVYRPNLSVRVSFGRVFFPHKNDFPAESIRFSSFVISKLSLAKINGKFGAILDLPCF